MKDTVLALALGLVWAGAAICGLGCIASLLTQQWVQAGWRLLGVLGWVYVARVVSGDETQRSL